MVKIQKPIPKQLGNKPKLDNPIKQKKQLMKKEKSTVTKKGKSLQETTPVKEAKVMPKPPGKEIPIKKQNKSAKKSLIPAQESPEKKQNGKGNNKVKKDKKAGNDVEKVLVPAPVAVEEKNKKDSQKPKKSNKKEVQAPKAPEAPEKTNKKGKKAVAQKPPVSEKPIKEVSAPIQSKNAAPENKSAKPGKKQNKKKPKSGTETESTPTIEKIKKVGKTKHVQGKKKMAKVAFKKAQLAAKADGSKAEKKKFDASTVRYEPVPYDEEKFNSIVNAENIMKIAKALKDTVEKEVKTKKTSIFVDYNYFLEVGSFKIPNAPKRMVKLNLEHSLVDENDDILFIAPDLQRGAKADYEETKQHYEDLLQQNGITGITVMPMNQLRKECRSFDQKRRLCSSYDYYICDGRIIAHVGAIVGKLTQRTRNTFQSVRLNEGKNIKEEFEKSLKRTAFRQIAKGSLYTIPVGSHKFSSEQLADNVLKVVDQLKTVFPGGLGNIRSLYLKIGLTGTSSLPLYLSMGQAPDEIPTVIGPREQKMIKLKREANEVLTKFNLTKEGKLVKLKKSEAEKKRKLIEMKAALKEEEANGNQTEESGSKAKKAKKDNDTSENGTKKKTKKQLKDLELPENEEDEEDEDDSSDDNAEDIIQLGNGSDDEETEDDEMANLDEDDTESGAEIVENGFVDGDDDDDDDDSQDDEQEEIDEDDDEEEDENEDEDDEDDDDDDDDEGDEDEDSD